MEQPKRTSSSSEDVVHSQLKVAPSTPSCWKSTAMIWLQQMTIFRALLIVYCLNVVAWGGMIFLLICNAAPAMCHPSCDDINSPRQIWIEIDSQILNALFCIPAFWLAPRRCIEFWKVLKYATKQDITALRQLAATYREWFRLPGSDAIPAYVGPVEAEAWLNETPFQDGMLPYPARSIPGPPPSGRRATPSRVWKLQAVVVLGLLNTIFQVILSLFMWCYNRHNRPAWSVGLFLCLAFVSSIGAGLLQVLEKRRVQRVEGTPRGNTLSIEDEELALVDR